MGRSNKTLHIVDKSAVCRASLSIKFRGFGYAAQIYEDPAELIEWAPDEGIVLLSDADGSEVVSEISRHFSLTGTFLPVAMYGEKPSTIMIVNAMLAGAVDYLDWPVDISQFDFAMDRIKSTEAQRLGKLRREAEAVSAVQLLSPREREVLVLMITGASNKLIANNLGLSPRTIEIHRAKMMRKLNAQSSSDAVRVGIYAGLDQEG